MRGQRSGVLVPEVDLFVIVGGEVAALDPAEPDQKCRGVALDGELLGHDRVIGSGQRDGGQEAMGLDQSSPSPA